MKTHSARPIPQSVPALSTSARWCCVQAGHRERYGIPRALERVGALNKLITDLWVPPDSVGARLAVGRLGRRLADRFHADLPDERVNSFPWRSLSWEAAASMRGLSAIDRVLARNAWWARIATEAMRRNLTPSTRCVFSYCYEARELFSAARALGLTTVLGQIDPGPVEDAKVAEIVRQWSNYQTTFRPGAAAYYENWREECRLASSIVVNSEWSRTALVQAGVAEEKINVVPLVYTLPSEATGWVKNYPAAFSPARPLRLLFLGQCILRKGIAETIEAAQRLRDQPVEFTFVGNTDITGLENHFGRSRIRYFPRVSRAECHAFYRDADAFLFPTHSDGFGLTQLEAQAWKLPIIASRFCAEVVTPGQNGWVLPEVSSDALVRIIEQILRSPSSLEECSRAIEPWQFDLEQLGQRLEHLGEPR